MNVYYVTSWLFISVLSLCVIFFIFFIYTYMCVCVYVYILWYSFLIHAYMFFANSLGVSPHICFLLYHYRWNIVLYFFLEHMTWHLLTLLFTTCLFARDKFKYVHWFTFFDIFDMGGLWMSIHPFLLSPFFYTYIKCILFQPVLFSRMFFLQKLSFDNSVRIAVCLSAIWCVHWAIPMTILPCPSPPWLALLLLVWQYTFPSSRGLA